MKPIIRHFVTDFLGEILQGNAAVFAGAGLSAPAGFVDWRELIRPLSAELELDIDLESDLVAVAQFHVNANGRNRHGLHKAVIEALSLDNPPTANHRLLAQLPIATWWTTNFDKLIETSLTGAGKVVDVKSAVPQLATTRPRRDATIFKMHGDVDRPDEAVATRDDFERYSTDRGAFVTALAGDLVSKTFLFVGFSFTDPNLEQVLSRVRLTFKENQRKHYAVFQTRKQREGESDANFAHYRTRQALVIEDLKRFNIKALIIDDYSEITEFLQEIVDRYRRRTVFISASAASFDPWGQEAVSDFAQKLGQKLASAEIRIATGLGLGIGDAIFTGALREVLTSKRTVEETLILRPFPQGGPRDDLGSLWEAYRKEIVSHAGIALFLMGNKADGDKIVPADGLDREFEIAKEQGAVLLPVGATGFTSQILAEKVLDDAATYLPQLDGDARQMLQALSKPTDDLNTLIEPISSLIKRIQQGK